MAKEREQQSNESPGSRSSRQKPQRRSRFSPEHKIVVSILIQARRDAGLTQVELAKQLGKVQSHVAYVEVNGRDLSIVEVWKWCQICGLDFDEFARMLSQGIRAARVEELEEEEA